MYRRSDKRAKTYVVCVGPAHVHYKHRTDRQTCKPLLCGFRSRYGQRKLMIDDGRILVSSL